MWRMFHENKTWREGRNDDARVLWVAEKKKRERERNHMNKTKNETKLKKIKPNRGRRKRSFLLFFGMKRINLGRDNRMRKILNVGVFVFVRVQVCLARRYREKYLRDRKKDSDDCLRLHFPSLFFFPPFDFNRAYCKILEMCMSRVARPRPDSCGVAYAWEREGVNIIINNVI